MATAHTDLAAGPSRDAAPRAPRRLAPFDRRALLLAHDALVLALAPALLLVATGAAGAIAPLVATWLALALGALAATDQYALARRRDRALAFATLAGWVGAEALAGVLALGPSVALALLAALGATGLALPAGRRALESRLLQARLRRRVLVVGTPADGLVVAEALKQHPVAGDRPIGLVLSTGTLPRPYPLLVLGGTPQLADIATRWRCPELVAGLGSLEAALDARDGLHAVDAIAYCAALTGRVPLDRLDARWLTEHLGDRPSRLAAAATRQRDVGVAGVALLILLPVMALIALVLAPTGAILDEEVCLGRGGRPIRLYAFRTVDAEGRVGRMGQWLRATGLARLPRLWSVVVGDLSLVGPAPHGGAIASELATYVPHYAHRLAVRPGLTGWAQVRAPFDSPMRAPDRVVGHDLYYLQHRSAWFDAMILARTPWVGLARLMAPKPHRHDRAE